MRIDVTPGSCDLDPAASGKCKKCGVSITRVQLLEAMYIALLDERFAGDVKMTENMLLDAMGLKKKRVWEFWK